MFRDTQKAVDFITLFRQKASYNPHKGFIWPFDIEEEDEDTTNNLETSLHSNLSPSIIDDEAMDISEHTQDQEPEISTQVTNSRKRSLNEEGTPAKHANPLDDGILEKRVGIEKLPVINLQSPANTRLIRSLDTTFLTKLKEKIAKDPSGPGVAPVAVLCTNVQDVSEFSTRLKDVYKYEVLGGHHTSTARSELHKENPDNPLFSHILAEIYVGLTDDEALRLASRHNDNGHFVHKMTHWDYVLACRSKLFALANTSDKEETPSPNLEWKKNCSTCILPEQISRSQKDNIFAQASLSRKGWELAEQIVTLFEAGDLKGQKLTQKNLLSKPIFKQQYIQPVQSLPSSFQEEMLSAVASKQLSLAEMKDKAGKYRGMQAIKRAFCRCTNTNWNQAAQKFPQHTTEERLSQFLSLNFTSSVPDAFQSYCQAAVRDGDTTCDTYTHQESNVVVVCHDSFTVSTTTINSSGTVQFNGYQLFVAAIPENWTGEEVKKLIYTSRQLNTQPLVPVFNCAIVCNAIAQLDMVKQHMRECYDKLDILYWYNKGTPTHTTGGVRLVPSVSAIVVGHFSVDGQLKSDHYNFSAAHDMITVDKPSSDNHIPVSLYVDIIEKFSFAGHTVIEAIGTGAIAIAALKCKRNAIVVTEKEAEVRRRITEFTSTEQLE